ncbi:Uncharacterised protein [Chromobacterium violaceum]|uniref:Uncharacterized protein n=1 Tax=Chromobacterium violaceum TaxID=536 RepID=A0A447TKT5_CHRVL|nr:Uncharacterised protein [Chromobacterium violaceum]
MVIRQPRQQALAALNRLRGALMLLGLAASALLMAAVYRLAASFSGRWSNWRRRRARGPRR